MSSLWAWILDHLHFLCIPYRLHTKIGLLWYYYSMLFKQLTRWRRSPRATFWWYRLRAAKFRYIYGIFKIAFFKGQYYFNTPNTKPLIIDCGANIWVTSLYFNFLFPQAEIHTFEPNPEVYQYLVVNTAKHSQIINHQLAVSNTTGTLDFMITKNHAGDTLASLHNTTNQSNPTHLSVQVIQLSHFIQEHLSGRRIDCIKFNIEGSEDRVVADLAQHNCLAHIDRMIFEYHHHIEVGMNSKLASMLNDLESHWFDYTMSVTNFRLYKEGAIQNLFIHAYRNLKHIS